MRFNFIDILLVLSDTLDYVENEMIGTSTHHGKRVAGLCSGMAVTMGIEKDKIIDLIACAILHDCALAEYIESEHYKDDFKINVDNLKIHCKIGEEYIKSIPLKSDVKGVLLYHHDNADGSGAFRKKYNEIPLFARMIHISDRVDAEFDLSNVNKEKCDEIYKYVKDNCNILFDEECVQAFLESFDYDTFEALQGNGIEKYLKNFVSNEDINCTPKELVKFSEIFAHIVDYKSHYTKNHSQGVAKSIDMMCKYYNLDEELSAKLYFAASVHDIGKLAIDKDILEKPGKLTDTEYVEIKNHAYHTFKILSSIEGLEDITRWASFHHETLDGKGYPFGLDKNSLDKWCRLMSCIDIYQALREERPYKNGLNHDDTFKILDSMVLKGKIDGDIVKDMKIVFK